MTKVSVGIPVRNGAADIERAIASVLRQTHDDVELVISDNDSSDATADICKRYAAEHDNIRYQRQESLLTVEQNVLKTIENATGEYYVFMGHDDELDPGYAEYLSAELDADPQAVLAGCAVHLQYKGGEFIEMRYGGKNDVARLGRLSQAMVFATKRSLFRSYTKPNLFIVGLFRRNVLEEIWRSQAEWLFNERNILVEAALAGRVCYVDLLLFIKHTSPKDYNKRNPADPTTRRRDRIKRNPRRHAAYVCWRLLGSTQVPLLRKLAVPLILPHLVMRRFGFRKQVKRTPSPAT
jgi:glycosyltransferase involved in cell wall biosynthesis